MNASQSSRSAMSFLFRTLRSSMEQTEAYLFAEAARRGISAFALNEAIGQLVAKRVITETVIDSDIGTVDALVWL